LQKVPKKLQNFPERFRGRTMGLQARSIYEFGAFRLDLAEHRLLRAGRPVPLTPKVFELLRVLVENAGHLVEKDRLLKELWPDTFVEEGNLNRSISVLRKALGEGSAETYIETVPKRGYRFVAPVRERANGAVTAESTPPPRVDEGPNTRAAWAPRGLPMRTLVIAGAVIITIGAVGYAVLGRNRPSDHVVAGTASIHRQLTFTGREITPALSPDGNRIAYVSTESPHRKVMVQALAGGHPVEVFSAPEAGALRWSPDSSELTFWARGEGTSGLFIAPSSGGGARQIAKAGFVSCWSPDGSTIALALFVARKIMFVNRLGEVQRTISLQGLAEDWIWDLDWSPVHGRLLFVASDDQRRTAIWTIQPDGSDQTKVLTANSEIPAARWAPAGDAIYYFGRVNRTFSLYKIFIGPDRRTTGQAPAPLISGLEADASLGLSADGKRLVYTRSPYDSNLWLVEAGDAENGARIRQTQLTHGTAIVERPRVSPDGRSIVFNMGYESRANLYTIPAAGGSPKQLTFLNAFSVGGAWSADSQSVAFASTEGGKPRVWVVNVDGTSPRPLSTGDLSDSFDIAWSPGSRLLYQQSGNRNFYVLDPQTRQERLLIKDSSVGWVSYVAHSPDGKQIAVSWNRRPDRGIWVIDSRTSHETLIYKPSNPDSNPVPIGWSPDGTAIYAVDGKRAADRGLSVSFRETLTDATILRVPVNGGPPETVLSLPFEEVGSVTMFPDGRRFLCAVYSSRSDVWVVENFDASLTQMGDVLREAGRDDRKY
jgi:Tol biopolymer transport system component/DNA-binding winged helix-turn-helix (wHTH) protein